ncbi:unnamed protein product [Durusdinium trenchii]|uniref:Uncharacterized protein n=2 Tax=Durusdinium trenchii TaxID=1381693 RepID=A0ABP0QVS5_9DINO
MTASVTSDALPSESELELISRLQERFKCELAEREGRGQLYAPLFGDLAFTRILRQNKLDLDASCEWIRQFFEVFQELEGDTIFPEMLQKMEQIEKEQRMLRTEDLNGFHELRGLVSLIYNAEHLTKSGDTLSFYPLGALDKHQIIARGAFERYERFVLHGWLLRAIELDRMSRRQERLCRVVNVIDVTGCTLSKVICKEFDQRAEKMMQRLEKLVPDLTAGNWVINAPWIMQKIFPWAKRALKIKVDNWFLCNGDGEQDPSLLSVVEVSQLRELREFRYRVKEESEKCDANMHYIGRGQVLEKAMEVRSGQRVCWKFLVMAGGILLPPPEIQFSVVGIWDLDDEDEVEEVLRRKPGARSGQGTAKPAVKPAMVVEDGGALDLVREESDDSEYQGLQEDILRDLDFWKSLDGENSGEVLSPKSGLIVLRWSNEFNMIRPKRIQFEVVIRD